MGGIAAEKQTDQTVPAALPEGMAISRWWIPVETQEDVEGFITDVDGGHHKRSWRTPTGGRNKQNRERKTVHLVCG